MINKFNKAFLKATLLHKGQTRKGTSIPYIVHILDVVSNLIKNGASEDLIVAGFLHDSIEDTSYTEPLLKKEWGGKVYSLVMSNTEPENRISESDSKKVVSWKMRKKHSLEVLPSKNNDELLLFAADKLSNLNDIHADYLVSGNEVFKRFNAPKKEIKWYYSSMIPIFKKRLGKIRLYKEFLVAHKALFE